MDKKENKKTEEKTVTVENLPDFSEILGFVVEGDNFTHLGSVLRNLTACGKPGKGALMSRNVTVNCPECVEEIRYRANHPEAAERDIGIVTHKSAKENL